MAYDENLVLDFPMMNGLDTSLGGTDGAVRDFSGRNNHGFPVNFAGMPGGATDVEFVDGDLGQSLNLPGGGADKHLNCGNDDSINTMLSITVEVILTPESAIFQDVLGKFNPAGNLSYLLLMTNTNYNFYTGGAANANRATSVSAPVLGNKVHIIGTHDGINTSIYVNGIWEANAVTPLAPIASTTDLLIGIRADGTNDLNAIFHRLRIWNRALGAAEIYRRFIHAARV